MFIGEDINIYLYQPKDSIHFFSPSFKGVHYTISSNNKNIILYDEDILEFDIDIDQDGNIGAVILNKEGKLYYYHNDGEKWRSHLLYELDLDMEEIKHISIKFSWNDPHIIFCWHNFSSSYSWSVLSFYQENNDWKKSTISRTYYKGNIRPYTFIKDREHNLYIIYLANNNMIYDLMMANLATGVYEWINHRFLCNCIYSTHFHLDALIDPKGILHISWLDKNKKNYCVKYIVIEDIKSDSYSPQLILENNTPFTLHHLFYQDNTIGCYILTNQSIYYLKKLDSNWNKAIEIPLDSKPLYFIKIIQDLNNPHTSYYSNLIVSESISSIMPIGLNNIEKIHKTPSTLTNFKKDSSDVSEKLKKLKLELYGKCQELDVKNNLLKTLESQIAFFKEEIIRLNSQHKNFMDILQKNNKKREDYKEKIMGLEKECEKNLLELQKSHDENKELLEHIQIHQDQLKILEEEIENLRDENNVLKKEIDHYKNMGLLRRLFP